MKTQFENMVSKQEWIPVTERLPEPYTTVLISFSDPDDGKSLVGIAFIADYTFSFGKVWCNNAGNRIGNEVDAWMPLAEPAEL